MRYLIITSLFFFGLMGSTLSAQGGIAGPAGAGSLFNDTILVRINRRLLLTDGQIPQVRTMITAYQTDLADNPPATPEDKRARRRAFRSNVMAILTPEQKARAKAQRAGGGRKKGASQQKRNWLDVIIDDVANPLIERRNRGGN